MRERLLTFWLNAEQDKKYREAVKKYGADNVGVEFIVHTYESYHKTRPTVRLRINADTPEVIDISE